MSAQAVDWALRVARPRDPVHKVVLLALANHAHKDGTGAYLSAATIAEQVGRHERSIRRYLVELEADGWIRRGDQKQAERIDPRYRPIVYDLPIQVGQNALPDGPGRTESPVQVGQNHGPDRTLLSYKPRTNQEINQAPTKQRSADVSPLLASLRTAVPNPAPTCDHGLKPWKCSTCVGAA